MLNHSKKYCINGCNRFVFAHNRCIYCYKKEILYPRQLQKQKDNPKPFKPIKKVSDKRKIINKEYDRLKEEIVRELIEEGKYKCFFTNESFDIKGNIPDFHHLLGRDGDLLTDKKYMRPVFFSSHRTYHDLKYDYASLNKVWWYNEWLERMKIEFPVIYYKEMYKIDKANKQVIKII